jgi:hypothetical protein
MPLIVATKSDIYCEVLKKYNIRTLKQCVGFEVLTAVIMKSYVFWDITPRSQLKVKMEGNMFLRNVGWLSTDCTAFHPRK